MLIIRSVIVLVNANVWMAIRGKNKASARKSLFYELLDVIKAEMLKNRFHNYDNCFATISKALRVLLTIRRYPIANTIRSWCQLVQKLTSGFTRPFLRQHYFFFLLRQCVNVALGLACCFFHSLYFILSRSLSLTQYCASRCFDSNLSFGDFLKRFRHSCRRENNIFSFFTFSG